MVLAHSRRIIWNCSSELPQSVLARPRPYTVTMRAKKALVLLICSGVNRGALEVLPCVFKVGELPCESFVRLLTTCPMSSIVATIAL